MRKLALVLPLLACMFSTVGCIDLEHEYTINPDGSGKVVIKWAHTPVNFMEPKGPDAMARKALKDEITQSEGVDAWKDVSCVARDDGKLEFKGTAYFKDFSKLKIHTAGIAVLKLGAKKDDAGNLVVEQRSDRRGKKPPKELTDEEAAARLKTERAKYQQGKPLIESMLSELKIAYRLRLPGKVGACSNFKKASDSVVHLTIEGKAMAKAMDEFMKDDAWLTKKIKESGGLEDGSMENDADLNAKLFGEKGPVKAVTAGELKPLFDYEKEAAAAREETAELVKKLGGGPVGPAAKGGDFKSLKVAGIRHVYDADMERGLGMAQPGVTISLIGELPGTVLAVKQGKVQVALTDNDEDVLPEEFMRTIHFVQLAKDKSAVAWDVQLQRPGDKARGFKEVSGVLNYVVGEKTKEVDLGLAEFKAGAKGTQFNARIEKLEDSPWQEGHQNLEIKIECEKDLIASFTFKDESGSVLATSDSGSYSMGEEASFTFTLKGAFPAKGKVVVSVYEDLKTYEIPFKIEKIDLLGKPLK